MAELILAQAEAVRREAQALKAEAVALRASAQRGRAERRRLHELVAGSRARSQAVREARLADGALCWRRPDEELERILVARVGQRVRTAALTTEDGRVVCARCAVADTPWTRMRGLLGRDSLAADEGLLIRPAGSIHMLFMRFAIDAVFLDAELRVLKIVRNLRPWRFAAARGAKIVVELAAGAANVEPGERLELSA